MSSCAPFDIPTLDDLGVNPTVLEELSPVAEANKWLSAFSTSVRDKATGLITDSFHQFGFWKDILALTWNFRTIRGVKAIRKLLDDRLDLIGLTPLCLAEDSLRAPVLIKPIAGVVFLRLCFEFETKQGQGKAIAFLVPTPDTQWKAWSLLTRLESLKGFPERVGALRDHTMRHDWVEERSREQVLTDGSPTVLIIGAGHTGLDIAARLKYMDVSVLVIDRSARIGDNWRTRYKSLCLHDTVWFNQMPYLPFPSTWPVFCPAAKLADWLEFYAKALELSVWLSSRVVKTSWNENAKTWVVSILRDGILRTMTVKHLVFATGYGGGFPKVPDIQGKTDFGGTVLHSSEYHSATEYSRKKVVVVGAANSALDIAMDLFRHNAEVTLNQRSSTYVISLDASISSLQERYNEHSSVEFSDLLGSALPWPSLLPLLRAETTRAASVDKSIIRGLESAGFRTNLGIDDGGVLPLIYARGGGLYVDTGASGEIIKGNIKIKSGCSIQRFTSVGLEFDDGSEMGCDVVIFATGYGESRDSIREVCGSEIAKQVGPIWGLDNEGELQGVWRRTGQPHLWIGMGSLGRSRFHSLHLALQIKALEEGVITDDDVYAQ
ncbi:hypothetical protein EV401DRAFT_2221114 [Pisolithus croceorrhizus]|nr:hypothetical protein EV401DRAFT_2221114 [Pisolithus croceorrhizus]